MAQTTATSTAENKDEKSTAVQVVCLGPPGWDFSRDQPQLRDFVALSGGQLPCINLGEQQPQAAIQGMGEIMKYLAALEGGEIAADYASKQLSKSEQVKSVNWFQSAVDFPAMALEYSMKSQWSMINKALLKRQLSKCLAQIDHEWLVRGRPKLPAGVVTFLRQQYDEVRIVMRSNFLKNSLKIYR